MMVMVFYCGGYGVSVIECVQLCITMPFMLCCIIFLSQARIIVIRLLLDVSAYEFVVC